MTRVIIETDDAWTIGRISNAINAESLDAGCDEPGGIFEHVISQFGVKGHGSDDFPPNANFDDRNRFIHAAFLFPGKLAAEMVWFSAFAAG
jgi:hypothetical protein